MSFTKKKGGALHMLFEQNWLRRGNGAFLVFVVEG